MKQRNNIKHLKCIKTEKKEGDKKIYKSTNTPTHTHTFIALFLVTTQSSLQYIIVIPPFTQHSYNASMCSTSSIIHHSFTASTALRGNLRLSVLPKDTSAHGMEKLGIQTTNLPISGRPADPQTKTWATADAKQNENKNKLIVVIIRHLMEK